MRQRETDIGRSVEKGRASCVGATGLVHVVLKTSTEIDQ